MDIEALKKIQVSPEYMTAQMEVAESGMALVPESVKAVFKKYANIDLTDEEVAAFNDRIVDKEENKMYYGYKIGWEIGRSIAEKYHAAAMSTGSRALSDTGGHTGNMVPLSAYGVGAERFEGVLDNTDVPEILRELLGYYRLLTAFSKNGHSRNPPMNSGLSGWGLSQTYANRFPLTRQIHGTDSLDDLS